MATAFNSYSGSETHIRIDPSVRYIPDHAFSGNTKLVEVVLPDSIQQIGNEAFRFCTSLARINLCEGLRTIGNCAFSNCTSLCQVQIPSTVEYIPNMAFWGNTQLKEVKLPGSIQAIGDEAFLGCSSLKKIVLREGLRTVGNGSFEGCTSLSQVDIPSTVISIDSRAFHTCKLLEAVHLREGLQTIGSKAFYGCETLSRVVIPSSVTEISASVFDMCTTLVDVHLCEGLLIIDYKAFSECKSLKRIAFPSTVNAIGRLAFGGCSSLKEVRFNDGLRAIGIKAFHHCLSLMHINIPSNVTFMDGPFQHCPILRNVAISRSSTLGDEDFRQLIQTFHDVDCSYEMLQSRFDELPLHKICYDRSHQLMKSINWGTSADFVKADSLGMTPLHMLACSGIHDLSLYSRIYEISPNAFAAKDKWGDLPLAYIIWSEAPMEVLHFFLEMHRRNTGTKNIDFSVMFKRLAVFAPGEYMRQAIQAQRTYFPDLEVEWNSIGAGILLDFRKQNNQCDPDRYSVTHHQTVRVLLEASVSKRATCMSLEHQLHIENAITQKSEVSSFSLHQEYEYGYEDILLMVTEYAMLYRNQLVDATTLLELALWKTALLLNQNITMDDETRNEIRSDSGKLFEVVIKIVLSFLW